VEDIGCFGNTCSVPAAEGNCNADDALCNTPSPSCQDGYYPSVVDECWSACVPEYTCVS
jgi:hypothetical protein